MSTENARLSRRLNQVLSELANITSAQANLYLFQEKIEQHKTIYAQIAEVGHQFNQSLDLDEVFAAVSRFCVDLLNYEKFALLLPNSANEFEVKISGGYYPVLGETSVDGIRIGGATIGRFLNGKNKWHSGIGDPSAQSIQWREWFQLDEFCVYGIGQHGDRLAGLLLVGNKAVRADYHRRIQDDQELDALFSNITSLVAGALTSVKFMQAIQHESARVHRLLNNMKQAVFSVNSHALISEPVSRFSEDMFGRTIVGANVYETVFKDLATDSEEYARMMTAFSTCFGEDDLQWMLLSDDFPKKFRYQRPDSGSDALRTLKLNVQPIWDGQKQLEQLMFVIEDVTEIEKLESQISKERHEIEIIQQILRNDLDNVRDFFNRSMHLMDDIFAMTDLANFEPEQFGHLMRTLHTIKGNARLLGFSHISQAVHDAESGVLAMREQLLSSTGCPMNSKLLEILASLVVPLSAQVAVAQRVFNLNLDFAPFLAKFRKRVEGRLVTREERLRLESVMQVLEIDRIKGTAYEDSQTFEVDQLSIERMHSSVKKVIQNPKDPILLNQLQESFRRLTEVPLAPFLRKFETMVQEVSKELEKSVQFEVQGKSSVKRETLSNLQDLLVQIIRNAVDHGIESPGERTTKGKSERGKLQMICSEDKNTLVVHIKDDGRGINPDNLVKAAIKKGLLTPEKAAKLSEQEKIALIWLPGFSSKDLASDLSGRGVGMDIVKATCERLKGKIEVKSEVGEGTEFIVTLPLAS